jgi:2-isopropylmalate synthase
VVETAIEAGASTVNIPDTVGYSMPAEFSALIGHLRRTVPNIGKAAMSVHCHNDLGMAVANSLAAVGAGARQVECTVNGIGERAGNASLEEVVMSLRTRRDLFTVTTGIDTREIYPSSRLLSEITGMVVQRNKAIVGQNAFAHEAGIHQHGVMRNRATYEIMHPHDVGVAGNVLVLGKHSGRHALRARLGELGFAPLDSEMDGIFRDFKRLADRIREVDDADLTALMGQRAVGRSDRPAASPAH